MRLRIDSNPPSHAFNCSHTWVLNARLACGRPLSSYSMMTRFGAEPSPGEGLQYVRQRKSVARWVI